MTDEERAREIVRRQYGDPEDFPEMRGDIAAALREAREAEREACYEAVRDASWGEYVYLSTQQGMAQVIDNALAAIRARGDA